MSDELQAEIDRLRALNEKLAKDVVAAHDDLKEVRGEARDRRHENKSLAQQVADLTAQRDDFKVKAEADPEGLRGKIAELTGKIRETTHRSAFEAKAKELKVSDPARVADLWALTGYKPEADQADPDQLAATIGAALKGRPWLVDQTAADAAPAAPGGATVATAPTPAVPGPGADRGQSVSATPAQASSGKPPGAL